MFRTFLLILFVHATGLISAQNISGIVNRYTAVTGIDTCMGKLQVSDTAGFAKGDAVLLIQMQGAVISSGNNSAYGNIQFVHSAGRYERAVLDSVGAGSFFLQKQLFNTYDIAGKVQVVRIAKYQQATVSDTVFAKPWDGSTGGILALEVSENLALNAPIVANGAGFRGGAAYIAPGNNCNFLIPEAAYFYGLGNWRGGSKGEGIALQLPGKELGRGPQANGGGGGNDHNAGGGGGALLASGGQGGENDEPTSLGCDGYYPGFGGNPVQEDVLRLFPGGGGGAGHANNTLDGSGGNGGGIIWISAGTISGAQPVISANGASAQTAGGDGGGGGGAGGSIWLQSASAPENLQLLANGGKGGNTFNNNSNRCFGPGGGGSGGRILTNLGNINVPTGGQAGIVTGSTNGCNGASNNAEAGENGRFEPLSVLPESTLSLHPELLTDVLADTVCSGAQGIFYVRTNEGNWNLQWQLNAGTGWQDIGPNAGFSGFDKDTLVLTSATPAQNGWSLRCRIQRAGCFEITSASALLTVVAAPVAAFTAVTNANLVEFSNQSAHAVAYVWSFGDGTFSTEPQPLHTYTSEGNYTVTLTAFNACDTVSTTGEVHIFLQPTAGFSVPDTTVACGPALVSFENLSSANSMAVQWLFPGGAPEMSDAPAPEITYSSSGNYSATLIVGNNAGTDTLTQYFTVQILGIATAEFMYTLLPGGVVQCVNTSAGAAGYTWDFGDGSPQAPGDSTISHTYAESGSFTITLIASNACGASVFQQNIEVDLQGVRTIDMQQNDAIRLYPNPLDGYLVVDCSLLGIQPDVLIIRDILGRQVLMVSGFSSIKPMVPMQNLPGGVYSVEVHAGRFVKRQLMFKKS
ncbi:MAG: PKD domain-containing protein [Saprospiraceae bacterium]|nr:PKD domain-containing protein [Saprospiraceae bacterium]